MAQRPTTDDIFRGNGQSDKSAGQLMKEVTEDLSTLIRKEIELAKQELGSAAAAKARGMAIIAVGAALGLFALIFMVLAVRDAFDLWLETWLADVVTAVILLVIAGIGVLIARKMLATPLSADMTVQTIKEDVEFAKTLGRRS